MEKAARDYSLKSANLLAVFESLQRNTLEAHRHLHQSLMESHRQFLRVTEVIAQQLSVMKSQLTLDKSASVDTLKQALQNFTASVSTINTTVKPTLKTVVATPTDSPMPLLSRERLQEIIITLIAEKTYLPEKLIDLDADLAVLGIDSIQRVEIFYALEEYLPQLAQVNLSQFADLSTLNAILDFVELLNK